MSSLSVVQVLRKDYIYPFYIGIDKNVIVSLSSGVHVSDDITTENIHRINEKTNKSKLAKNILSRIIEESSAHCDKSRTAVSVNLMLLVRTISQLPETFEGLALKLIQHISKGYRRIDIVAIFRIQSKMQKERGMVSRRRYLFNQPNQRFPGNFLSFIANVEDKTKMIKLIFETLQKKPAVLNTLRTA